MTREEAASFKIPLYFSRSRVSTEANRTGNWSFVQPAYRERTAPCSEACPCGTDIPRVETLASRGLFGAAYRAILMENPLPGVCGRVCFHPCEGACNRGERDEAVAVNALERFLEDAARRDGAQTGLSRGPSKRKRVAVIGSGPAGLSAAHFLARLGYACEIFESLPEPGGMLRWGIPAYRLPPEVLRRELDDLEALGVKISCGSKKDASFLSAPGFDAVFLSPGQGKAFGLGVPGEELARDGLELLKRTRADGDGIGELKAGDRVAVVGGGNTAIDVARTLLRKGLKPLIVYRRRREDMPAFAHEVERALAEGAELLELSAPLALSREGPALKLGLQRMRAAATGADGRRKVEAVPGETGSVAVAAVFAAVGAEPEEGWKRLLGSAPTLRLARSSLSLGPVPVAFAGDLATEEKSVSEAVASGKEAALALDAYFEGGAAAVEGRLAKARVGGGPSLSMEMYLGGDRLRRGKGVVRYAELEPAYFPRAARARPAALPPKASLSSFVEVEAALAPDAALAEAGRCMSCGACNDCDNCRTFCPDVASRFADGVRSVDPEYCKGCGVCAQECPRGVLTMEREEERR